MTTHILVGQAEIAEHFEVKRRTVEVWRQRHDDFPEPYLVLTGTPIWQLADVEQWHDGRKKSGGFSRSVPEPGSDERKAAGGVVIKPDLDAVVKPPVGREPRHKAYGSEAPEGCTCPWDDEGRCPLHGAEVRKARRLARGGVQPISKGAKR